jgi:hypothetical protein
LLRFNVIGMPIRINLLAEQQAAEELRRRDPVKRATWAAGFALALLLVWAGFLQVRLMGAMREVERYGAEVKALEKEYNQVAVNLNTTAAAKQKIAALQSLATNHFLWGPALNALQYAWVEDVQTIRLRTEQTYTQTEGIKPSTNAGVVLSGKAATARERVILSIEAKDSSSKPGDQILKFQEKINNEPYFKTNLQKSELTGRTPIQTEPSNPSRPFVLFTVECQFTEKRR